MSVKKAYNGKWQARWRDADGNQKAKSFRTKADALAHDAEMRRLARDPSFLPSAGEVTINDLADQWLAASPHLSPGGLEIYRRDLDNYVLPAIGTTKLGALTPEQIEAYLASEMPRFAASTVHRHYRTIHAMLEFAVQRRMVMTNASHIIKPPRVKTSEVRFLTAEEVERLADCISGRYRAFVLVAAYGGLRWGELIGLRRSKVDGARLTITEQLVYRDRTFHREPPKTPASRRTVLLPDSIAAELEYHLDTYVDDDPDALVFTNQKGDPTGHSFRWNVWRPACLKAGLSHIEVRPGEKPKPVGAPRIHDLRHTAVTLAIAAGAHPKAIQQRMGHSSITVTLNTYGHLLDAVGEEVAEQLDKMRPSTR